MQSVQIPDSRPESQQSNVFVGLQYNKLENILVKGPQICYDFLINYQHIDQSEITPYLPKMPR